MRTLPSLRVTPPAALQAPHVRDDLRDGAEVLGWYLRIEGDGMKCPGQRGVGDEGDAGLLGSAADARGNVVDTLGHDAGSGLRPAFVGEGDGVVGGVGNHDGGARDSGHHAAPGTRHAKLAKSRLDPGIAVGFAAFLAQVFAAHLETLIEAPAHPTDVKNGDAGLAADDNQKDMCEFLAEATEQDLRRPENGDREDVQDRYYFATPYHSWHGSPSTQDSNIPLIVAHAGKGTAELGVAVRSYLKDEGRAEDIGGMLVGLRAKGARVAGEVQ